MKTYRIEVQRIKGMSNANGMLHAQIDASVLPATAKEDAEPTSWLSLSEESARTLQLLLKAQFAQIDGRKARSNGELIAAIVALARAAGREIATPAEARQMLHLAA